MIVVAVSGWRKNAHDERFLNHVYDWLWPATGRAYDGTQQVVFRVGDCASGTDEAAHMTLLSWHLNCSLFYEPQKYVAYWNVHPRAAGPIRNREMLLGKHDTDPSRGQKAHLLLAWPQPRARYVPGSGTWDCIQTAHQLEIPVVIL